MSRDDARFGLLAAHGDLRTGKPGREDEVVSLNLAGEAVRFIETTLEPIPEATVFGTAQATTNGPWLQPTPLSARTDNAGQ